MDFEKRLYEDSLKETGIIKYNSIKVNGDELIFELEESIENKDITHIDFEFVSEFDAYGEDGVRSLPKNIDALIEFKQMKNLKHYKNIVYK